MGEEKIVKEIRAALEKDTRINLHRYPIQIAVQNDGDLILDGVVADIAAKKLALVAAAEINGVQRIVDRLKVTPAEKMGDAEIRDHVCKLLLEEIGAGALFHPRLRRRRRRNSSKSHTRTCRVDCCRSQRRCGHPQWGSAQLNPQAPCRCPRVVGTGYP